MSAVQVVNATKYVKIGSFTPRVNHRHGLHQLAELRQYIGFDKAIETSNIVLLRIGRSELDGQRFAQQGDTPCQR